MPVQTHICAYTKQETAAHTQEAVVALYNLMHDSGAFRQVHRHRPRRAVPNDKKRPTQRVDGAQTDVDGRTPRLPAINGVIPAKDGVHNDVITVDGSRRGELRHASHRSHGTDMSAEQAYAERYSTHALKRVCMYV